MADTELPADETINVAPMEDVFATGGSLSLEEASRDGLGHLTRVWGSIPRTVEEGVAELIRQHEVVLEGLPARCPALVHEECLTGFTTYGATVYPRIDRVGRDVRSRAGRADGYRDRRDMAAVGVHQGLSPVLDVVRDYRWGRVEETIGEDPYFGRAAGFGVRPGLQSAGVLATLQHFAGYSASRAGRNHGPVSMGPRELLDIILPTFETAIATAGAASVMSSYADIDGLPASADPWLFTDVLRDEWGFGGTVVSDYWAVPFLASMHRVAADDADAGVVALTAGTDVELPDTIGFAGLLDKVKSGDVSEDLIDRARGDCCCRRSSSACSIRAGRPRVRSAPVGSTSTRRRTGPSPRSSPRSPSYCWTPARRCRCRPELTKVAVIGPCAGDSRTLMGCYAFPNHVLPRYPDRDLGIQVTTRSMPAQRTVRCGSPAREGLRGHRCGPVRIRGGGRSGAGRGSLRRVRRRPVRTVRPRAPRARGVDAEDLRLPVSRPTCSTRFSTAAHRSLSWWSRASLCAGEIADRVAGLVQAFIPGQEGAGAIAGVLTGRIVPSGKLPVQIPRHVGGQPARTCSRLSERGERGHQRSGGSAAVPLRVRRVVHELRGRRSAGECVRDRQRR
jgi:beta-glucosidase